MFKFVIVDTTEFGNIIKESLSKNDFQISHFTSINQALAECNADSPCVILCNLPNASKLPSLENIEEHYIKLLLTYFKNQKDLVAKTLGINRRTLYRKERKFGIVTE